MRNRERDVEDGMGFSGIVPTLREKQAQKDYFREACQAVERACRRLGGDVQVIFFRDGVEIARLDDVGSTVDKTLYSTLKEIEKYAE